jgi:Ulp1 family protease
MFERRVAGGRFEGVGTVANVYGAHWAAVYISKRKKSVEYFDPEGTPPSCSLEVLLSKLAVRVGREVGRSAFRVMISKRVHQKGGARCGLYSLTYIFRRLIGMTSFMDFSKCSRIGDEELVDVAATLFELT